MLVLLCSTHFSTTKNYSVQQKTTPPVIVWTTPLLQNSTPYYNQSYSVLQRPATCYFSTTPTCYSVLQCTTPGLLCTTKYYSSSTPVLQNTTKYCASTTKYYTNATLYYKILRQYYSVLQSTTAVWLELPGHKSACCIRTFQEVAWVTILPSSTG